MHKKKIVFTSLLFLFVLVGCNEISTFPSREPDITGYVMDKQDQSISVVSSESKKYSDSDGNGEYYEAIVLSDAPSKVTVGDQVTVWYGSAVLESYPAQSSVGDLEILPRDTPEGATLSTSDALNKALSQSDLVNGNLALQSITYDENKDEWSVTLTTLHSQEEYKLQTADK